MFRHLYIHLPYCVKKCPYCDFFSVADDHRAPEFMERFAAEFERAASEHGPIGPLDTLFVGGGTPTHLPEADIARFGEIVHKHVTLSDGCEWTVEANPESATRDKLALFRNIGVTRISLGVQSLDNNELQVLGRPHASDDVGRAVEAIRDVGFASWSLDLIFGVAGQSLESWRRTVEQALAFDPPHMSAYALMIEPGSEFARDETPDRFQAVDDLTADQYDWMMDRLAEAGYEHYEVSNYAKPGHRCRHNDAYWLRRPYLGLGPSAHSFDGVERWWNVRSIDGYLDRIGEGRSPIAGSERLGPKEIAEEQVMLGLRRAEGLRWHAVPEQARIGIRDAAESLAAHSLVVVDDEGIRLVRDGWPVADMVIRRILDAAGSDTGV